MMMMIENVDSMLVEEHRKEDVRDHQLRLTEIDHHYCSKWANNSQF